MTRLPLQALLRSITTRLCEAGVDSPRLSAELLAAHAFGLSRQELLKELLLRPEQQFDKAGLALLEESVRRRALGEPAAYILGEKEFYGRPFQVSPSVLIPRPETELLIDAVLDAYRKKNEDRQKPEKPASPAPLFADFGTGSGCIAVTLGLELPGWRGLALDKSPGALKTARENASFLGASGLNFLRADFTSPPLQDACLSLLLCNPPYIGEEEYSGLEREVRNFEPKSALVPGAKSGKATGLEDLAAVIAQAGRLLKRGGRLFMEMGCGQKESVLECIPPRVWDEAEVRADLAGLPRLLVAKKR